MVHHSTDKLHQFLMSSFYSVCEQTENLKVVLPLFLTLNFKIDDSAQIRAVLGHRQTDECKAYSSLFNG